MFLFKLFNDFIHLKKIPFSKIMNNRNLLWLNWEACSLLWRLIDFKSHVYLSQYFFEWKTNKQTNKQKQKQKNITERKLKFPILNNIHARHFPCTIISFFELKTSSFYNLNGPKFRAKLHNTHISVFIAINFQLALEGNFTPLCTPRNC